MALAAANVAAEVAANAAAAAAARACAERGASHAIGGLHHAALEVEPGLGVRAAMGPWPARGCETGVREMDVRAREARELG